MFDGLYKDVKYHCAFGHKTKNKVKTERNLSKLIQVWVLSRNGFLCSDTTRLDYYVLYYNVDCSLPYVLYPLLGEAKCYVGLLPTKTWRCFTSSVYDSNAGTQLHTTANRWLFLQSTEVSVRMLRILIKQWRSIICAFN